MDNRNSSRHSDHLIKTGSHFHKANDIVSIKKQEKRTQGPYLIDKRMNCWLTFTYKVNLGPNGVSGIVRNTVLKNLRLVRSRRIRGKSRTGQKTTLHHLTGVTNDIRTGMWRAEDACLFEDVKSALYSYCTTVHWRKRRRVQWIQCLALSSATKEGCSYVTIDWPWYQYDTLTLYHPSNDIQTLLRILLTTSTTICLRPGRRFICSRAHDQ